VLNQNTQALHSKIGCHLSITFLRLMCLEELFMSFSIFSFILLGKRKKKRKYTVNLWCQVHTLLSFVLGIHSKIQAFLLMIPMIKLYPLGCQIIMPDKKERKISHRNKWQLELMQIAKDNGHFLLLLICSREVHLEDLLPFLLNDIE
jgi:hypothetical protein